MGSGTIVRAIALAAALYVPAGAHAVSLVPHSSDGGTTATDFRLFPFWQKLLADMGPQPVTADKPALPETVLPPARLTSEEAVPILLKDAVLPDPACPDQRHCAPGEWTDFLETLKNKTAREQIEAVNRWANSKPYIEDIRNWFIPDYWATPGEFLARGGDCEDFAAIKYFSLVRLGRTPDTMRIMVVRNTRENNFHAVLTIQVDGRTLVLDNFLADVTTMERLPYYQPIYSLNEYGWMMHTNPTLQMTGAVIVASPASGLH